MARLGEGLVWDSAPGALLSIVYTEHATSGDEDCIESLRRCDCGELRYGVYSIHATSKEERGHCSIASEFLTPHVHCAQDRTVLELHFGQTAQRRTTKCG